MDILFLGEDMNNITKKNITYPIEIIVAIVLGLLAIASFVLQALTFSSKTAGTETALFNMLQFLLTIGFTWFTTRAISKSEFDKSLKRFAISAYRRIADIEKMIHRLRASISQMTQQSPKSSQNDLHIVAAIVEDTLQVVKSSIEDWADVIGDELIALERLRRLKREKAELRSSAELTGVLEPQAEEIKNIETQIDHIRSKLPPNLFIISERDEEYKEIVGADWLADRHKDMNGFHLKVVAGGDYSTEPDPEKVNLKQKLTTHRTEDNALDLYGENSDILGRVLNPLPYNYDQSVRAIERCYGTTELNVEFLEIKKKYKIHDGNFMHFLLRILNVPRPKKAQTVIITP